MPIIDIDDLKDESSSTDDEQLKAHELVCDLINEFLNDTGYMPSKLFVNENDELQSLLMWSGHILGLTIQKTKRDNYVR